MAVIKSLLDTDLYKLTMQAVVWNKYYNAEVEYLLTNRSTDKPLNLEAANWIRDEINSLEDLRFTKSDLDFLKCKVPYLPSGYYDYLETLNLNPRQQVEVQFTGDVVITVKGPWRDTILYEIPILALVSEAYFKFVDTKWNYDGQVELAQSKAKQLFAAGCKFSEFGTRRRRSFEAQQKVLEGILSVPSNGQLIGTSNVYFAKRFDLQPIGTVAHELMMGIATYHQNFKDANRIAMDDWLETVGNTHAGFALTDTFGTPNFLESFVKPYTDYYVGVRQDSGDPVEYTNMVSRHYKNLDYEPNSKMILYSDSLNLELCVKYKNAAEAAGLLPCFGIGTFFTNDFKTLDGGASKPLNIVMKINTLDGKPCVKLSDNAGKNMGDIATVQLVKQQVHYHENANIFDEKNRW